MIDDRHLMPWESIYRCKILARKGRTCQPHASPHELKAIFTHLARGMWYALTSKGMRTIAYLLGCASRRGGRAAGAARAAGGAATSTGTHSAPQPRWSPGKCRVYIASLV